jgi:predicted amidohydrolase
MTLTLAAAQSASLPGDVPANVARHLRMCAMAAEHGVRLLVFPELSLTGYDPAMARVNALSPDAPALYPLRRLAGTARMTVVVGAPVLNGKNELHLAALALCPDGAVLTYAKEHLHSGEEPFFVPGHGGATLPVGDATVALAICADTTHPRHAASAAERGANVYAAGVLITENGYARDTAQLMQYAREHRMAVLMANHSAPNGGWVPAGKSAIWSEDGKLVAASTGTEEALVIARRRDAIWDGMVLPA